MIVLPFDDARKTLNYLTAFRADPSVCHRIDFLTPLLAVSLCGAFNARRVSRTQVKFGNAAHTYAQNCGLLDPESDSQSANKPLQGMTYCSIQRIRSPDDVDRCNESLTDLLCNQPENCRNQDLVRATSSVIGEIHDNVASHANDQGFSAAQVYNREQKQIQIAVADIGRGIGGSIRSAGQEYKDYNDRQALEWCLVRGNTSAKLRQNSDSLIGPQKIDHYAFYNPFPSGTPVSSETNNHMGEGFYKLVELIKETRGKTWIWSGNTSMLNDKGFTHWIDPGLDWRGTIVAIEIPIDAFQTSPVAVNSAKFDELAQRLKL